MGPRIVSNVHFAFLLALVAAGCGSEQGFDPNESASSRAIRAKVRIEMEAERLQRIAPRLAHATAAAAASPTATSVPSDGSAPADEPEEVGERGGGLYAQNCSSCHGLRGAGDGPVAGSLLPQPARHDDGGYMNALSNEHLFKVIKDGGPAVGKAPTMAPWGATMGDDQINDVIAFVRSLAEPPYSGPIP